MKGKAVAIMILLLASVFAIFVNVAFAAAPTYSALSTSSTVAGLSCQFNATFTDDVALETDGQYIFETNNTGSWVADAAVNFTSTPETCSVSKTLNITTGTIVSYRWNFTDHAGESNTTGIQSITITNNNPTIAEFEAPAIIDSGTYFFLNATINDADGVAHINNATIQISCPNLIVLSWDNATATFAEVYDVSSLCALDTSTSTSASVNATALKISWYLKLHPDFPEGNVDIVSENTVSYDIASGSGSGSYTALSVFNDEQGSTTEPKSDDGLGLVWIFLVCAAIGIVLILGKGKR